MKEEPMRERVRPAQSLAAGLALGPLGTNKPTQVEHLQDGQVSSCPGKSTLSAYGTV